ncbi:MAG: hypothetical protein ACTHW1_11845 [Ancrocorticia sp.]|uniref:hypothetical protein n=1 Tax=Ancrocorticia sp. TaxID=2593684 RepID=UPI003F922E40
MFGKKKRERIIEDWAALQDVLIGDMDAEETGSGALRFTVEWKSEKRKRTVTVAYAPVGDLGQIAYITAPIIESPRDSQVREAMEESAKFLEGGVVFADGALALRSSLPFQGLTRTAIIRVIRQVAANADVLASSFEKEE